jgi:hypothetical protein
MGSVGYWSMLTFNSGTHQQPKDHDCSWPIQSKRYRPERLIDALPNCRRKGGCLRDEPTECLWAAKYMEHRIGCVAGNCCPENRTALIPVGQKPTPEITTFAGSANGSPSAADKREVQKDDRICRTKPDLDSVIGSKVTIHDPAVPSNELLLHHNPLLTRCCDKPRLPKDFVHFDHRQPRNIAQAPRQSRFARRPATDDDHAFHNLQFTQIAVPCDGTGLPVSRVGRSSDRG